MSFDSKYDRFCYTMSCRPFWHRTIFFAVLFFLSFCLTLKNTQADDLSRTQSQIENVQSQIKQYEQDKSELTAREKAAQAEINKLTQQSRDLTATLQQREKEILALQIRQRALQERHNILSEEIHNREVETAFMLQALVNLSLLPSEALLLSPDEPIKVLRTYTLLGEAVPSLKEQMNSVSRKIAELEQLNSEIETKISQRRDLMRSLQSEQKKLSSVMAERQTLLRNTRRNRRDVEREMQGLNAQARDLDGLLTVLTERIETLQSIVPTPTTKPEISPVASASPATAGTARRAEQSSREASTQRAAMPAIPSISGSVVLPAAGHLVRDFGHVDSDGSRSQGITLETVPGAAVVAPIEGRVRYAGYFRSFNNVVIIEHQGGYFSMISGMEDIYVDIDSVVSVGEPIGVLSSLSETPPTLYYEIRKNGKTLNPRRALHQISGGSFRI